MEREECRVNITEEGPGLNILNMEGTISTGARMLRRGRGRGRRISMVRILVAAL